VVVKLSRWEQERIEKRREAACGKPSASGPCSHCKRCHAKMVAKVTAQIERMRATMDRK
jgi:hypothetical protein